MLPQGARQSCCVARRAQTPRRRGRGRRSECKWHRGWTGGRRDARGRICSRRERSGAHQPLELVVDRAHVAGLRRVAHELLELVVLLQVRLCPLRHWRRSSVALAAMEDPRVPRVGVEDQDALDDGAAIHEPPPPVLPARIRRARPCVFVAHELVVLARHAIKGPGGPGKIHGTRT